MIFGVYIPVISAIRAALGLQLSYVPNLIFFGLGIVAGACSVVKIIKVCLERFRPQTLYCIVGMMVGSFYAIVMGPTTLEEAQARWLSPAFIGLPASSDWRWCWACSLQKKRERKPEKQRAACLRIGERLHVFHDNRMLAERAFYCLSQKRVL